jgi:hypothetical protein
MDRITPAYWPNTPSDFAPDFGVSEELARILVRDGVCSWINRATAIRMVQPWRTDDPNAAKFVSSIQSLIMGKHVMDAVSENKQWAIVMVRAWGDNHAARPTPGSISRGRSRRTGTRRDRQTTIPTVSPMQESLPR